MKFRNCHFLNNIKSKNQSRKSRCEIFATHNYEPISYIYEFTLGSVHSSKKCRKKSKNHLQNKKIRFGVTSETFKKLVSLNHHLLRNFSFYNLLQFYEGFRFEKEVQSWLLKKSVHKLTWTFLEKLNSIFWFICNLIFF